MIIMEYKVIREDEFGILVEESISGCCKKCKYQYKFCSRIDKLICVGGYYLTEEEENLYKQAQRV